MSEGLWNDQGFFDIVTSLFVPNLFVIDQFTAKLDPKEKIVILAHQNFLPNAGIAQSKRKNIKIICGALYPSIFRTSPKSIKIGSFTLPNILKKLAWYFLTKKDDRKYQTSPCIKLLNQVRKEQGLSPIKSYTDLFDRIASLNALLFSSWFGPTHHEWPKNIIQGDFLLNESHGNSQISTALQDFLSSGEKPILFTFGTGNMHTQKYIGAALESIKTIRCKAIYICNDQDRLPKNLPSNIFWLPYFDNFRLLLEQCSMVVYHGGIGTFAEAARCGIPQLSIPSLGDQWDNAERIENLHLGGTISIKDLNAERLTEKINSILAPHKILKKCRDIQVLMSHQITVDTMAHRIIEATKT